MKIADVDTLPILDAGKRLHKICLVDVDTPKEVGHWWYKSKAILQPILRLAKEVEVPTLSTSTNGTSWDSGITLKPQSSISDVNAHRYDGGHGGPHWYAFPDGVLQASEVITRIRTVYNDGTPGPPLGENGTHNFAGFSRFTIGVRLHTPNFTYPTVPLPTS